MENQCVRMEATNILRRSTSVDINKGQTRHLEIARRRKPKVSFGDKDFFENEIECEKMSKVPVTYIYSDNLELVKKGIVLRRSSSVDVYFESIFKKCDRDQDGFVSLEEFTAFIKSNEQVSPSAGPLTPIIVNNYERFDQNHDNKLDFEEFVEMITNDGFLKDFTNLGNRYVKFLVVPVCRTRRINKIQLQRMHTITGMYENEVKFKPTDIGMILLSIFQIILFYSSYKEPLVFKHDKRQEVWRYMTYMFTHNSQFHLLANVAIQLLVGLPLEMVHSWRVLIIYCAGILGGSLFQSVIYPEEDLAGGSPGVYSIFTAHIATVIMNWREMSQPFLQLILFGSFTVFDTIYKYVTFRNKDDISYISHLGGAICGLLVGVNILRNLRETRAEKIIWWISIIVYVGMMSTFICLELSLNVFKLNQS